MTNEAGKEFEHMTEENAKLLLHNVPDKISVLFDHYDGNHVYHDGPPCNYYEYVYYVRASKQPIDALDDLISHYVREVDHLKSMTRIEYGDDCLEIYERFVNELNLIKKTPSTKYLRAEPIEALLRHLIDYATDIELMAGDVAGKRVLNIEFKAKDMITAIDAALKQGE